MYNGSMNVFLQFKQSSLWGSSVSLEKNFLRESSLFLGNQYAEVALEWDDFKNEAFWSELRRINPSRLYIFDNRFDLRLWVPLIYEKLGPDVAIVCHLFGNPLERLHSFFSASEKLKGKKLFFSGGSLAQVNLLKNLLNDPANVLYLPFIPDQPVFSEGSSQIRSELGVTHEKIFLYTGRISWQKNVHRLLSAFTAYSQDNPDSILLVCGSPDNVSTRKLPPGYYLNYAGEVFFKQLEEETQKGTKIIYLGRKSRDDVFKLYEAADHFLTLSTFEGEDFGLSLSEAFSRGLSVSATRWGGHREYEGQSGIHLEEVGFENGSLSMDIDSYLTSMKKHTPRKVVKENFLKWRQERVSQFQSSLVPKSEIFRGIRPEILEWSKGKNKYELEIWNEEVFSPYWK